jgi:hypothetical protein
MSQQQQQQTAKTELYDWNSAPFGESSSCAQRRRIMSTTRVAGAGLQETPVKDSRREAMHSSSVQRTVQYSVAAARTAYSEAFGSESAAVLRPREASVKRGSRAEGGTWKSSQQLYSALHQSGTTMADAKPMQRDISERVVVQKIHQPNRPNVDNTVVRLEATRVRGVR